MLFSLEKINRKGFFILFYNTIIISFLFFNSCSHQSKKINKSNESQYQEIKSNSDYKQILNINESHCFSNTIVFKGFKILSNEKNYYRFIWLIDKNKTDISELKKWKLGLIIKPQKSEDLTDVTLKAKGMRSVSVNTKIYRLGEELVITYKNLHLNSNQLDYLKFYLFNRGKFNLNYWTVKDIKLDL